MVPGLMRFEGLAEGGKIDLLGIVLTVDDPVLLQVEGDNGELADAGIARDIPQDRHQRARVEGLQGRGPGVLRREIDQDLDIQRRLVGDTLNRRFVFELFALAVPESLPGRSPGRLLVLGRQSVDSISQEEEQTRSARSRISHSTL